MRFFSPLDKILENKNKPRKCIFLLIKVENIFDLKKLH